MDGTLKRLIKIAGWGAILIFLLLNVFVNPTTFSDYVEIFGQAATVSSIFVLAYNRFLWCHIPLEKTPRIKGQFYGTLIYEYNGTEREKKVSVNISQTLLSTKIKFSTDETSSVSVTSKILCENGDYFLYYTYITQPQSKVRDYNPAQYGACRLEIVSSDKLTGFYWTSSKTRGDFILNRKPQKRD